MLCSRADVTDRHQSIDLSPEELAAAHKLDLEAQDKYAVRYHTYWFDPDRQSVFCLARGPIEDAIEAVHQSRTGSRPTPSWRSTPMCS